MRINFLVPTTALLLWNVLGLSAQNNVGIGTNTPNPKSLLELQAQDKGFLVPRLTAAQRVAINPVGNADAALLVYDTDDDLFYFWNSTQWVPFPQTGTGNNISLSFDPTTDILSLTDNGGTLTATIPDTDQQTLTLNGNQLNISNGNTVDLAPFANDWKLLGNAGTNPSINFLGTTDNQDLVFRTNNTEKVRVLSNGNVGIGTITASAKLEVFGGGGIHTVNNDYSGNRIFSYSSGVGHPYFMGVRGEGTLTAPAYPTLGKVLSSFIGRDALDYGAANYGGASIYMVATENFSQTAKGTRITLSTTANGSNVETERMTVQQNGSVGIGTSNPQVRLHVTGPVLNATGNGRRFAFNIPEGSTSSAPSTVAYFEGDVLASLGFYAINNPNFSDERIKQIIGVTNNEEDAELISRIQITDYRLIDTLSFGNRVIKKVIAQQVEQIIPEAIYEKTNFIPSVFALSEGLTVSKTNLLEIKLPKAHGFKEQDRVQINLPNGKQYFTLVQKVLTERSFAIENTADLKDVEEVLVYGKEISDFKSVDYDALTTLNISTSQYLLKKVRELEEENNRLKASNTKAIEELRSEIELLKKPNPLN